MTMTRFAAKMGDSRHDGENILESHLTEPHAKANGTTRLDRSEHQHQQETNPLAKLPSPGFYR